MKKELLRNKFWGSILTIFAVLALGCKTVHKENLVSGLSYVSRLELKESNINEIISEVKRETENDYDSSRQVFVMNIGAPFDTDLQVRMAIFSHKSFGGYLRDEKDKPFGFYINKGDTILIFGGKAHLFFSKLPEIKRFDFLYIEPEVKPKNGVTPPSSSLRANYLGFSI